MDPEGTVALVTGGASGLGLAAARRLLARGAQVVLVDLKCSAGAKAADELGANAVFAPADVTDAEQVGRVIDRAADLGELRIVLNCAGIGPPQKVLGRDGAPIPIEDFRRIIDVNLIGTFNVLRLAAARIAAFSESQVEDPERERGVIVNTASVAAFDGQIGQTAYSASKAAIAGMTLPLAREFARHRIRVMTVAPGLFRTPILESLSAKARASLAAQVPNPSRLGEPDEFGMLIEHIVDNPMLNGETIRLDGAIRMAPR